MIDPFPRDWELMEFFGCEPSLLDPNVPWVYNLLRYESENGGDRVVCDIEPASEIVEIKWWQGGILRLELGLHAVKSLTIDESSGAASLILELRNELASPVTFQVRPHVAASFGTAAF